MSDAHHQQVRTTRDVHDAGDVETPGATDAAEPGSGDELEALRGEVENLRAEKAALYDKLARVQADYQNSQRRLEKDMDQRLRIAAGQLVRAFLPILDNLERAMDVPPTADLQSVLTGVRGTYDGWVDVLKKNGVTVIAPQAGETFDPSHMEALMQEPADYPTPTVTRLLAKGYEFDGRVLRPAQVAVSQSQ